MAYRNDVDALAARLAAIDGEVADRTRARDEIALMLEEARALERAEAVLADRAAGGPARRRRRALLVATALGVSAVAVLATVKVWHSSSCEVAIDHAFELLRADLERVGVEVTAMPRLHDVAVERCRDDRWTTDAIDCLTHATSTAETQLCQSKLDADQTRRLQEAMMKVVTVSH